VKRKGKKARCRLKEGEGELQSACQKQNVRRIPVSLHEEGNKEGKLATERRHLEQQKKPGEKKKKAFYLHGTSFNFFRGPEGNSFVSEVKKKKATLRGSGAQNGGEGKDGIL